VQGGGGSNPLAPTKFFDTEKSPDTGSEGFSFNDVHQFLHQLVLPLTFEIVWRSENLLDLFHDLGSSGAQVNTFSELFAHPQMAALDMVREIEDPALGKVTCVVARWQMDRMPKAKPLLYHEHP
jgi:hypothetical protein